MDDWNAHYRGRAVAVSGASGYIGTALTAALRDLDAAVVRVDARRPNGWREAAKCDVIFHLAANTSARAADLDPQASFRATVQPVGDLAAACRAAATSPRVILASTATVYGLTDSCPVDESATPSPQTTYDLHKLWAEQQLAMATGQGVMIGSSLRLANVYGPSRAASSARERGFLNRAAARAAAGEDLDVYGDGAYRRDFIALDDVVRAMLCVGSRSGPSVCNVATGESTAMRRALEMIAARASALHGRPIAVRSIAWPDDASPIERRNFAASIDRIGVDYGWRPTITLQDGIDRLVAACVETATASAPPACIRLNLGCGGRPLAGYINIDADSLDAIRDRYPDRALPNDLTVVQYDLFHLPFADATVDEVRADSLIEHLAFVDEPRLFHEMARVLRPGGTLRLTTVDFEAAARQWLDARDDWRDFYRTDAQAIREEHWFGTYSYAADNRWGYQTATLFGNQNGDGQFHRNCYSEAKLRAICARLGLRVERVERARWQGDRDPMLVLVAKKPETPCA
jgi:nucleoside-diphosphate-sugar epimerase/SAM-dependent methyltransferase